MKVKKFMSTVLLLIVAFVTSLTFAFSAVQYKCVICDKVLVRTNLVLGMLDYKDYFGCQEIDGLKTRRDLAYVGYRLLCVENDDGPLCYSCASSIINEKAIARDTEYSITVPESVVLSKTTTDYSGTYTGTASITASGFIQLDQRVYFTASTPEMRRTGSATVKGTVTATTATDWESMDVSGGDAKTEYTVSANITPGDWTGTMTFYATVSEKYDITLGDNTNSLLTQNEDIANIKFSSSAPEIATVDNTGCIQTVSAGNTTITKMVYDSTGENLLYTSIYDITVSVKTADMVTTLLIEPLQTITAAGTTIDTIQFGQYTIPSGVTTYDVSGDGSNTIQAFVDGTALKVTNTKPSPLTFAAGNSLSFGQDSVFADIKTVKYESVDTSKVTSAFGAFKDMTSLESITGLEKWDTSNITTLASLFANCSALGIDESIISSWDTSRVTSMNSMFLNCSSQTGNRGYMMVEDWNTSNVTDMGYMFSGCENIGGFYGLWTWDTSKVKNMHAMFQKCSGINGNMIFYLSSRDNPGDDKWDSSNVTDMAYMFDGCTTLKDNYGFWNLKTDSATTLEGMFNNCSSITDIEVNWSTDNVTNMSKVFNGCTNLSNLNVGGWNTSNATDMSYLFSGCKSLSTIDIKNFDTSNVKNMQLMFAYCESLSAPNISAFDTSKVTTMRMMFYACKALTSLDVSSFNTAAVTDMNYMFGSCESITTLNVSNFNTAKVTGMVSMFSDCHKLTSLDVSNFDTSKVTNMNSMFSGCWSVTALDVSNFNTSKVTDMAYMFNGCNHPPVIDVSKFDTHLVTSMKQMFTGCYEITKLDLSNFDTSKVTNMNRMFYYCKEISELDISNFNASKVTDYSGMFGDCWSLRTLKVNGTFATSNLPNPGVTNNTETGLLFVKPSDAMTVSGKAKLPITISGEASDALQAYDFATDNREVTFKYLTVTFNGTEYKVAEGTTVRTLWQKNSPLMANYLKSYRNQLVMVNNPTMSSGLSVASLEYPSSASTLKAKGVMCVKDGDGNICKYNEELVDGGVYTPTLMNITTVAFKTPLSGSNSFATISVPGGCTWAEVLQWWGDTLFPGYTMYADYIVGGTNIRSTFLSSVQKSKLYSTPDEYLGKTTTTTGPGSVAVSGIRPYVLISSCYTNTFEKPCDVLQDNFIYDLVACTKLNSDVETVSNAIQYGTATIGIISSVSQISSYSGGLGFPFVEGMSNQQVMESFLHSTEATGSVLDSSTLINGHTGHFKDNLEVISRLQSSSTDYYLYRDILDKAGNKISASAQATDKTDLIFCITPTSTSTNMGRVIIPDISSSSGATLLYYVPTNATGEDFITLYRGVYPYAQVISSTKTIVIDKYVPYANVSATSGFIYLTSPTNSTTVSTTTPVPYVVIRNVLSTGAIANKQIMLIGYKEVTTATVTPLDTNEELPVQVVQIQTPETAMTEEQATPETAMEYDERPAA